MAKALFLMRYPLDGWNNLKNKFDGQLAAMEALGHEAWHIGYDREGMWLCRRESRTLLKKCPLASMPGYSKTYLYVDLMAALKKAFEHQLFQLVYMRYMPVFWNAPSAIRFVKQMGAKLILEHPTYPFENGRTTSLIRKPVFKYNDHVFAKLEAMIDLYALIGDPCGETLNGVPAMNIVNGVDVDRLPLHAVRKDSDIHLLALASMSHWQGYDRLIEALAAYDREEKITIHMVGGEGDGSLAAWKKLAQDRGVEEKVIFHGEMFGEKLNDVVESCDVGVGGLGLYRKKQFQSMTLKLREYMARGLPFVYAVDDPSVPDDNRFCLKLPNDDSALSMAQIVSFVKAVKQDASVPAQMRNYARRHMSWQGVMKTILEKVEIS